MASDRAVANEVESIVQQFDAAWGGGTEPAIDEFLRIESTSDPDDEVRFELLLELVMIDMEYRWRDTSSANHSTVAMQREKTAPHSFANARPRVEDYVEAFPEFASRTTLPPKLIANEYRVRCRWGDRPELEDYFARFGGPDAELREELLKVQQWLLAAPGPIANVHCPHCHHASDFAESDLSGVECPSCGHRFNFTSVEDDASAASPRTISHFELEEMVGQGSFGTVWKARDHQLQRTVAVKVPRRGELASEEVEQFLREARVVAQLRHPHIVAVHEVGRDGDTVYIASDFVQGESLESFLKDQSLTARECAELCSQLAEAIEHAHQAGVIHRDLKPANILLDADRQPHVTDFGLAKRDAGEVTMTLEGKLLGTPAYMSPEQASGKAHLADQRSDVYSLGVILFETLTGEKPFRGNMNMLLKQIVESDPPRPRTLNGTIPRDLETICLKCLRKEPDGRYQSAGELSNDLRRFVTGEPIHARPVGQTERAWRWCKRNPAVAGLLSTVACLLLLLAIGGPIVAANQANLAAERRRQLYATDMGVAQQAWENANVTHVLQLLRKYVPRPREKDLRGFQWFYLWRLCQESAESREFRHGSPLSAVAFCPEGKKLATAGFGDEVKLWNVDTGELLHTLPAARFSIPRLRFSPDGKTLAAACEDSKVMLWTVGTGKLQRSIPSGVGTVIAVVWSPDGSALAWCGYQNKIMLMNTDTNAIRELKTDSKMMFGLAFSPDGKTVASAGMDQLVTIRDLETGAVQATLSGHQNLVWDIAFSPDGTTLMSGSHDMTAILWDVQRKQQVCTLAKQGGEVVSVAYATDGQTVATASFDGTVKLWDVDSGQLRETLKGHAGQVWSVAVSPDGKIASASLDGTAKVWSRRPPSRRDVLHGHTQAVESVVVLPNEKTIGSTSCDGTVRLWDLETGAAQQTFVADPNADCDLAVTPGGRTLLSLGMNKINLWDSEGNKQIGQFEVMFLQSLALSPDGGTVATGDGRPGVQLWDLKTQEKRHELTGHDDWVWTVAFNHDGSLVASGSHDHTIRVWNTTTGSLKHILHDDDRWRHTGWVLGVAFSPDGRLLVSGSADNTVKLWDVRTGELLETLMGHSGEVWSVAFSPDGKILASASSDRTVKLWYVGTKREPETLTGHTSAVRSVAFSPSGQTLVSGGADATVRIWRAATEAEVRAARW